MLPSIVNVKDMKPVFRKNEKCVNLREELYSELSPRTNGRILKAELLKPATFKDYDEDDRLVLNALEEKRRILPKSLQEQVDENKKGIERQLEASSKRLQNLISVGHQLAINIKTANEKRETLRSQYDLFYKQELQEDLKKESLESVARFNNIASKWSELELVNDPIEVSKNLEEQKECISEILNQKDNIIKQCQEGIDFISQIYCTEKENNSNDINRLVERIDKQIELLKEAYNERFSFLYDNMQKERSELELAAANKWKSFYDEMLENENTKLQIVKEKELFYAREVSRIREEQEAITRSSRIRLEKEAEILQRELRNSKSFALITSEKLDYNYQVLQKRNEENVIINNQQKRRVAKLTEGILILKKKIREVTFNGENSVCKFVMDIKKIHFNINDLENKFEKFKEKNNEKYYAICAINLQEIQAVLNKIFQIDKVFYEQQLALPWTRPELDMEVFDAYLKPTPNSSQNKLKIPVTKMSFENTFNWRFLRNILRSISDRANYLVEEKLIEILKSFKESDNCLIRLENIFTALKINDIKIIYNLIKVFEPYCWCPNCSEDVAPAGLKEIFITRDGEDKLTAQKTSNFATVKKLKQQSIKKKYDTCTNHYLVIEPGLVIAALKQFTKCNTNEYKNSRMTTTDDESKTIDMFTNAESLNLFWENLYSCIPKNKSTLWSSLSHGLTHYLDVLVMRESLDKDCNFLRKQNMEFLHMFQKIT